MGAALGAVRDNPAAQPFAAPITNAAKEAFVSGLHITVVAAAVIMFAAVLGVLKWLPAHARIVGDEETYATAADAVPMGIGPVDVVPAELAGDLAAELEIGSVRRGTT